MLQGLWEELLNLGQLQLVFVFRVVLVEKWSKYWRILHKWEDKFLHKDPIPQIDKVFSLIRQEERQRSTGYSHNPSYESNALFCKTDASKHAANKQSYKKREKLVCTHCGLMGHTMDKCYKLHGYPPGYKTRGKGIAVNQVSVSNVRLKNLSKYRWVAPSATFSGSCPMPTNSCTAQ